MEVLTFVKAEWVKPLWKQLERISGERAKELDRLRDEFVDPDVLKQEEKNFILADRESLQE